jgi:hypothetical protein
MSYIQIQKKLKNIKFPKILLYNTSWYIYGINSVIDKTSNINKFILECYKYDENFNFINKLDIKHNFETSTLLWQIIDEKDYFIFLIEQKSIDKIKHSCKYYKYYIKKTKLENFDILKIEKIPLENHLISKLYLNYTLASKIEIDEERPDYYWGKYLFCFLQNDTISYIPEFDAVVSYDKDKGHILHYIEESNNTMILDFDNDGNAISRRYFIIFSIRHKNEDNLTNYHYQIYSAYSDDLKYFYDTKKIKIENKLSNSDWYCYPEVFKNDNNYFILLNQDDFGKSKNTLIGKLTI